MDENVTLSASVITHNCDGLENKFGIDYSLASKLFLLGHVPSPHAQIYTLTLNFSTKP